MSKRLVVDLGNVELDSQSLKQVEGAVQKAALSALAEIDYRGDLIARFPKEWLGIWIDIGRDLNIVDRDIASFAKR